jgi:hypothetical protein
MEDALTDTTFALFLVRKVSAQKLHHALNKHNNHDTRPAGAAHVDLASMTPFIQRSSTGGATEARWAHPTRYSLDAGKATPGWWQNSLLGIATCNLCNGRRRHRFPDIHGVTDQWSLADRNAPFTGGQVRHAASWHKRVSIAAGGL